MGGGKRKQVAQRIKNNARPSSSGRSAELLHSSTALSPQFGSLKDMGFLSAGLSLLKPDEFDPTLDTDFQMVFKKMNKKDCTTKLKALQEFSELVAKAELETIKIVLNSWCRVYSSFAMDSEHRIREAVQNAHHQIILKDKKAIAPFLKQIIGPWFTSQYDTYPPAASAATKAFTATFPENKTQDCIIFCQKEILNYIKLNLDAENVNNPKNFALEDVEARLERIFISSLQGYCMYLTVLSTDQIKDQVELNNAIISNAKFPKIASHKSAVVKASWFKVLTALYQKAPCLLTEQNAKIIPLLFANLDENDPTVVNYVWEAALLCISHVEEWWKYVNVEKVFIAKIFKVLKEGGQGSALVIYPNFLTILSKLPPTLKDVNKFYENFFDNLRVGLDQKSVIASKSEGAAVATSLVECVQYVIMINSGDANLSRSLIQNHLLPVIERGFTESRLYDVTVLKCTAGLVQFWSKNQDVYSETLTCFWNSIEGVFENVLRTVNDTSAISELAQKQTKFLKALKSGGCVKNSKEHCVKFSTPTDENVVKDVASPAILDEKYEQDSNRLIYVVLKSFVDLIKSKGCQIIDHFYDLVSTFGNDEFMKGLARHLCGTDDLMSLFDSFLSDILINSANYNSETVINLTFLLLQYVNDIQKADILNCVLQVSDDYFDLCIIRALSPTFCKNSVMEKWLQNDRIRDYLMKMTRESTEKEFIDRLRNVLTSILSNSDTPIFQNTLSDVVSIIQESLVSPKDSIHSILNSSTVLATFILNTTPLKDDCVNCCQNLVLSLFSLTCEDLLSAQTTGEMNEAWQKCTEELSTQLSKADFINLTTKVAKIIENKFLNSEIEVGCDNLTGVMIDFIRVVYKGHPILISDVFNVFASSESLPKWRETLNKIGQNTEYLLGNLCSPFDGSNLIVSDVTDGGSDILRVVNWTKMTVEILAATLEENYDDSEDEVNVSSEDNKIVFEAVDEGPKIVSELLNQLAGMRSLLTYYKTARYYEEVKSSYERIRNKIGLLVEKLQSQQLMETLGKKLYQDSWLWANAIYLLHTEILKSSDMVEVYDMFSQFTAGLSSLQLLQVFGKHLNFDHAPKPSDSLESVIISRILLHCDEIDVQIAQVFGIIEKIREKNNANFLYENKLSWSEFEEVIEIIRFFSVLIKNKFVVLSRRHWDFSVISLVSWASNCYKNRAKYEDPQFQAFVIAVTDFFIILVDKIAELKASDPKNNYVCEWEDLFFSDVHNELLQLWIYFADQFNGPFNKHLYYILIQEFGKVVPIFDHNIIFKSDGVLPNWSKFLKRICGLLVSPEPSLQLWGYQMLLGLNPGLISLDMVQINNDPPQEKSLTIEGLKDILQNTNQIVGDLLTPFKLGEDICAVKSFTDSYTYVHAYLLLWSSLLSTCEKSPPELRYQYVVWLRHGNLIENLLNNLFKLLPTVPSEALQYKDGKARTCSELGFELFLKEPNLSLGSTLEPCNSLKLEHLACWVYSLSLFQLPVVVRQWWSNLEPKIGQIVENVTTFYISPHLCKQELKDVANHDIKFKNMTIKVLPSVREVIAIYTIDEAQMELSITLPINYPLGGPDVQCTRQIGGTAHKQWLMQLKKCLLHQNGRIWDGLFLWNSNLDKKFDGIDECYICFAVLHPGSYQLPKLSCQTCKKKFHSACLYKWFSTSNKSTCPICRNLF